MPNNEKWMERLKAEVNDLDAPNLLSKIKAEYLVQNVNKTKSLWFNFRFVRVFSLMAVLVVAIIIVGIFSSKTNTPYIPEDPLVNIVNPNPTQERQLIAFEVTSGITFISGASTQQMVSNENNTTFLPLGIGNQNIIKERINIINRHIGIVEHLLHQESPIRLEEIQETERKDGYEYQYYVINQSVFGDEYIYYIYYNEEINEEATTNAFNGIVVLEEDTIAFSGEKVIETLPNGEIDKTKFRTDIVIDNQNWVKIRQEFVDNTTSFIYQIKEDGRVTKSTFKRKFEKNKVTVGLEVARVGLNFKSNFKIEKTNNQVVIIINNEDRLIDEIRITIDSIDGKNVLKYNYDGFEDIFEKRSQGNKPKEEKPDDGNNGKGNDGDKEKDKSNKNNQNQLSDSVVLI